MGLNYLYLSVVVFIVMVKAFIVNYIAYTNDVIISYTCHSGLHYNGKNLYDKSIHIQMMLDTDFH